MKKILLLITIIIPVICTSQYIDFENHTIINFNENEPLSSYSADMDDDGDLDYIASYDYYGGKKIVWFENLDGLGNFGNQHIVDGDLGHQGKVTSIDMDNDGDMDIVNSIHTGNMYWYENIDGNGNFSNSKDIRTGVGSGVSGALGDIDGDGDIDAVFPENSTDGRMKWYKNEGDFFTIIEISTSHNWSIFASLADLDGDGDLDLISTSSDTYWYENLDGFGDFGPRHLIRGSFEAHMFFTSDLDNDGDLDIGIVGDSIKLYRNNGSGVFSSYGQINEDATDVVSIDVDSDGDNDILMTVWSDWSDPPTDYTAIGWYENDGFGTFNNKHLIALEAGNNLTISIGDINNDNKIDILSSSFDNNRISWYQNDGFGNFSDIKIVQDSNNIVSPNNSFTGDIDGDGDIDILLSSFDDDKISWLENIDGLGNFSNPKVITVNANGANSVFLADIDNDGDLDAISGSALDDKIAWYENTDGNGNFSYQNIISLNADSVSSIYAIDIDNDNDIDVISTSVNDNEITWYENINQGTTFNTHIISTSSDNPNAIFAIDIDNDSDNDIIITSYNDNKVAWYENTDGIGNFSAEKIISTSFEGANYVSAGDIDNDGDVDIISTSFIDDKIAWFENTDGLGNFSGENSISSFGNPTSISLVDLDLDSDLDVVISSSDYDILCRKNDGFGNFSPLGNIILHNPINSISTSDFNGDGNIDVISVSTEQNKIFLSKNLNSILNSINGKVQNDINVNGCDSNDLSIPNILITTDNGTESFSVFSFNSGFYQFSPTLPQGTYNTTITTPFSNYYSFTPISQTTNFSSLGANETIDFCVEPLNSVNDLNISIIPTDQARPGFDTSYQIIYKNVGTTQLDGDIIFEFDNTKMSFLNATEPITSQTSNSLTFNYVNLAPFETRIIDVEFNVHAPTATQPVNIGDILSFTATINPIVSDFTADDNIFTFNQTVIGSYDPNDMTCLEDDEILLADADKYLHYVIRFQNTGTASAVKVVVENILDDKLDWSTIQLESISHNNKVEIKNGNEVSFIFNAIYLPDSTTDEPNSHGFIAYKIKLKADIELGDIIPNKADIFFDFNEAIETNTATTTIVNALSVNENTLLSFSVYPTPTENILNVKSNTEIIKIEIYSKLGQLIIKNTMENKIDISNLMQGLYFVKAEDVNGNFGVKKIVKK